MEWALAFALGALAVAAWSVRRGYLQFRERLRAYLRRCPDIEWRRTTPAGVVCAVSGYPLEVDLLTTYLYRRRRRVDEEGLFAELVAALRTHVPPVAAPPFSLVQDRILPLLKRTADVTPAEGYRVENRLLRQPFDDAVSTVFVIAGLFQVTYVTEGMARAWGVDREALYDLALANLRARTLHILEEIGGPREEYVALDGYDAARLLVADLIVPAHIREPVVAIPHEHACLIARSEDAPALARRAAAEYRASQAPLTPRLYRLSGAGPLPHSAGTTTLPEVDGWKAHGAGSSASRT